MSSVRLKVVEKVIENGSPLPRKCLIFYVKVSNVSRECAILKNATNVISCIERNSQIF